MKRFAVFAALFALLYIMSTVPGHAQVISPPQPPPPPLTPVPPPWRFEGLRIEYQRVEVAIEDQIATTRIDQLFANDSDWMVEGTYLFPLPEGAAVSQLTMWVNGEPIEAKILKADEARQIYNEIVRQMRDPALLEYVGSSAIQANVFPIPAHDERRVEIEYTQILEAENGLIRYIYPQSNHLYTNSALENQNIRVEIRSNEAIRAIYSPSHSVSIDREGEFGAVVGYEDSNVFADKDFALFYTVTPEDIGLNLLSFKESGEDGFFLLLVAPKVEVDPSKIVAKDIILVLDTSGSMQGTKITQAKEAALSVIDSLNPRDRFNIVSFSTGVRLFENSLVPADDAGDVRSFIDRLEAIGGTNISQALLEAAMMADGERPTTIIFLTDGLATEGVTETDLLLETVRAQTPENVRIFAFGVGNDVDTLLLDSLAQNHGGTTTYVRPGEPIDEAVSAFYAKVSTPVLANIELDFEDAVVEQLYPQSLPDLFAGTQLVLTGRYREGGPTAVTLTGEVNGEVQQFLYEDHFLRSSGGEDFIPRLWATRAIGHMLTQIRLHGEDAELVSSIVNLSIRYGIITPYTSYLIEEDDIFTQSGREMIVEEAGRAMSTPMPSSGAAAVDAAAEQADLSQSAAPLAALPTATIISPEGEVYTAADVVRTVGSKTFVLRDGLWVDTAYQADSQTAQEVGFASDAYFDLLSAAPEMGQYLSIGQRVLVVFGGTAYEIVEGEGQAAITIPDASATEVVPVDATSESAAIPPDDEPDNANADPADEAGDSGSGLCAAVLLAPLFFVGMIAATRKRGRPVNMK